MTLTDAMPVANSMTDGPWLKARAPSGETPWLNDIQGSIDPSTDPAALASHLQQLMQSGKLIFPASPVHFISDIHADARALLESLVLAGVAVQTGPKLKHFSITATGLASTVVIGGDCLDKGPSNLKLLGLIQRLRNAGLKLRLLAGNHDLRLALGLQCFNAERHVMNEHLFVRMGSKTLPLLAEIWRSRLKKQPNPLAQIPTKQQCYQRLLPDADWAQRFRKAAVDIPAPALEREITRIEEKTATFRAACKAEGLSIRKVYAAATEAQRLFMTPSGEFAWFLPALDLFWRSGSFLFVHAGLDDDTAETLASQGSEELNRRYRYAFKQNPFVFYASPLGNSLRTKYRPVDFPLTPKGVGAVHDAGVHAIVHGHRSHACGQRLALRAGLLHIEGDVTLDRNTRAKEGLTTRGAGVISLLPDGQILGMSADYAQIKVLTTRPLPAQRG